MIYTILSPKLQKLSKQYRKFFKLKNVAAKPSDFLVWKFSNRRFQYSKKKMQIHKIKVFRNSETNQSESFPALTIFFITVYL